MDRKELIKKYIEFFKSKNHKEIPNASLIPENDPTVLFTTAGMHPLVPFLLGQPHPSGKRLVNVQRCIRTGDIDEVGDTTHHTFFEMLGNWSVGDYFKKEAIEYSFEFATKILKLPIERLAVTCFEGDNDCPKDNESAKIWESLKISKERIAFLPKKDNWWGPAGKTGPCGPDTEMFYWKSNNKPAPKKFNPDENWVEIWNDVLMQYNKDEKGSYNLAKQKNIDNGRGVERILAVVNGLEDNYLTEVWQPIIKEIEKLSEKKYSSDENKRAMRIIADHIKASVFIISDGITPSNTEQGYVLRRLIRRAIRYGKILGMGNFTEKIAEPIFEVYNDYEHLQKNKNKILGELKKEEEKFNLTLEKGLKIFERLIKGKSENFLHSIDDERSEELSGRAGGSKKFSTKKSPEKIISSKDAFLLFQSYGFPIEMIIELAKEKGIKVDEIGFQKELQKHQDLSRTASAGKFKSGLADNSEQTTKLHTAAHLLLRALQVVLKNDSIIQKGSNITAERLRLDFNFPRKLEKEELEKVEELINEQIKKSLEVKKEEMSPQEAKKKGASGSFDEKYGDKVFVYSIGNFSKEICTGPHVSNTSELGNFKIQKEESVGAGVRRIKAGIE